MIRPPRPRSPSIAGKKARVTRKVLVRLAAMTSFHRSRCDPPGPPAPRSRRCSPGRRGRPSVPHLIAKRSTSSVWRTSQATTNRPRRRGGSGATIRAQPATRRPPAPGRWRSPGRCLAKAGHHRHLPGQAQPGGEALIRSGRQRTGGPGGPPPAGAPSDRAARASPHEGAGDHARLIVLLAGDRQAQLLGLDHQPAPRAPRPFQRASAIWCVARSCKVSRLVKQSTRSASRPKPTSFPCGR